MSRIRTFVALDIGKRVRSRCAALQESLHLPGVRWVKPDTMHLTLCFLGDVEDRDLARVCKAVADGAKGHPPFSFEVEGVGCFPHPARPRTVWAGIGDGVEQVKALQASIDAALVETGLYRSEERPYNPHLTLGRFKFGKDITAQIEAQSGWAAGSCEASEVLVMSSELGPDGPEYTVLGRAPL
jgi:2'-5' RNA ligase